MSKEFKEKIEQLSKFKVDYWMTNGCDMNCFGCFGAISPIEEEMGLEEIYPVFHKLYKAGARIITLTGGEPLIKPETVKTIKFLDEIGFKINLSTNGTFLMKNYSEIKNHVYKISLSLDGSNKEKNELVGRREYHFENITNILKSLKDNPPNHLVKIGTVVSKLNILDMENIGNFLFHNENHYKPDDWRLLQFFPTNNPQKALANKEQLEISDEDFLLTVNHVRNAFPEANITAKPANENIYQYVFITPDGFMQIKKGHECKVSVDLKTINQSNLDRIIKLHQLIVQKAAEDYFIFNGKK